MEQKSQSVKRVVKLESNQDALLRGFLLLRTGNCDRFPKITWRKTLAGQELLTNPRT